MLVSHFRESDGMVRRFLASVDSQVGDMSGVSVTVCDDGAGNAVGEDVLGGHLVPVRHIVADRGGVSHTRNALLDAATGDHLMFCDCDDVLSDARAVARITGSVGGCDVLVTPYLEELQGGGVAVRSSPHMVQGKVFRRKFLTENGIRFCDDLVVSGDPYLTSQALHASRSTRRLGVPTYLWARNDGSVSREDGHLQRVHWLHVECDGLLADRFLEMGLPDARAEHVQRVVCQSYVLTHCPGWRDHGCAFELGYAERILSWWLRRLWDDYSEIPERERLRHYRGTSRHYGCDPGFDGIAGWARDVMELRTPVPSV